MLKPLEHPRLAKIIREAVGHAAQKTMVLSDAVMSMPSSNYTDPDRFNLEVRRIFRRLPMMLGASAELKEPGSFKTMTVAGVPVLITRGADGAVRSFINSCTHRGTAVATEERGSAKRFTCPYHGWTFGQKGELLAVASAQDFGEIDKSCHSLRSLPVAERAGLIFGSVDPKGAVDLDQYLCGIDAVLQAFNFENWYFFGSRRLEGPNWKIAFDGYLDLYHLPVLHRQTFGHLKLGNRAIYHHWGPHQHLIPIDHRLAALSAIPEDEWPDMLVLLGVWALFPGTSMSGFAEIPGCGRAVSVAQLFPGSTVGSSYTYQSYLLEREPTPEAAELVQRNFDLLETVVRDEDYATGFLQQQALEAGGMEEVKFGRNEGGLQEFHRWVDRIVSTADEDLGGLFQPAENEVL